MKYLGRFFAGIILALSLTLSASAGHIPCPGITDDQPPPTTEETVTGDMPNGIESTDTVTGLLLSLLVDILPFI